MAEAVRVAQVDVKPEPALAGRRLVWAMRLTLVALATAVVGTGGLEVWQVALGHNLHEVLPGRVYRSAHLSPHDFQELLPRHGIRTVIGLRGTCPECDWYQEEAAALRAAGVAKYDVNFSSYILPAVPEMQKLLTILATCEYPVLIHCRRGADRTGLAAAITILAYGEGGLESAHKHLSWRYGHLPLGRRSELGWVLEMYEDWLREREVPHTTERFRTWAFHHYRPRHCWAMIEPLEVPTRLPYGRPAAARFRVHNTSRFPWEFRRETHCGVHLRYLLTRTDGTAEFFGGAGFFDQIVGPGESLELTLALPAVRRPGRYTLLVDMLDEQRGWFFMVGSEPFKTELDVDEPSCDGA
jgi:protein tyrosine phosphatase (PTP) superfamily phosphohydrolase (DUF442 family)